MMPNGQHKNGRRSGSPTIIFIRKQKHSTTSGTRANENICYNTKRAKRDPTLPQRHPKSIAAPHLSAVMDFLRLAKIHYKTSRFRTIDKHVTKQLGKLQK